MKRIALLVLLVLGFAVGRATAQDVTYHFDRDSDFSKFKSYKWVQERAAGRLHHRAGNHLHD
jgi:hypothetical protein